MSETRTETATVSPTATRPALPTRFTYQPSLDGLRALAVLAIIGYHFNYGWARGAYLSVDLFFLLSGFLITTLLIMEWRRSNMIALRNFWGRRARRLLPALLVLLVFVAIFTRLEIDPWNRTAVRNDGIASLFYVANWRFIADKQNYFELFSAVSPLRHMWTLAIEEQFYLVWPLVFFAVMRLSRGSLRALSAVCCAGIVGSVIIMATTYTPTAPLRAYYGTDSRAHTILFGALLAILLSVWVPSAKAKRRMAFIGVFAFVGMLYAWNVATGTSSRYYHGGSAAYAVLACTVIAASMQPGVLHKVLSVEPLAWIGRLSYGIYLFHWPIIIWLVPTRAHVSGLALNAVRLTATFVAAIASFYLVELPIRERRLPWVLSRLRQQQHQPVDRMQRNVMPWLVAPALGATLAIVFASSTGATAAPSYLTGTKALPTIQLYNAAGKSITFPQPKANFIWAFGDPLFCGTPRTSETKEAVDEARKLGAPVISSPSRGLRVLLLGDSAACSFYPGMKAVGDQVGVLVAQSSVFGCGMASGYITTTRGEQITPHSERCPAMVEAAQVPAIAAMRPDVVIWMSLWEKSDVIQDGRTLVSGTPAGDAEMLRRMDAELARITKYGAKVVLPTIAAPAPNDAQGTSNTSNAVDNASYARLDSIDRRFAARHPGVVTLVDLAKQVCPKGAPCPRKVNGLVLRPDGRHFTPAAASIEARWLMPQLVAIANK
jgi:peptidoglycan/LPS O-acetylase OafA/YrhL